MSSQKYLTNLLYYSRKGLPKLRWLFIPSLSDGFQKLKKLYIQLMKGKILVPIHDD